MRLIDGDHFDERVRLAVGMAEYDLKEEVKDGVLMVLEILRTEPTITAVPMERIKQLREEINKAREDATPVIAYPSDPYFAGKIDCYERVLRMFDNMIKEYSE